MKLAVVGSRNYKELYGVAQYLGVWALDYCNSFGKSTTELGNLDFCIITGGAEGVDTEAENWCKANGVKCEVIRPISNEPISYLFRNVEIITKADKVIAFWDGESKGTKFVIDYCKARRKPLEVIE
jgi:hypothetical protein